MNQLTRKIEFVFIEKTTNLRNRTLLKKFIIQLHKKYKRPVGQLTFIFCSDNYLLSINQSFLKHDFYTDIITFDLSPGTSPVQGEVYISLDRVRENAATYKQALYKELHRVIFHGALHLCGFKDKKTADQVLMRQKEDECLSAYFTSVSRETKNDEKR